MSAPPPIARRLLRALLPARVRDTVLEDIDRRYRERLDGPLAPGARRWYRRQVLDALVPAVGYRLGRGADTPSRLGVLVSSFSRDLAFAVRQLRRSPGFGLVVVATLGVGIGANTAIFSVVDGVLLSPLPYADPERLVTITTDYEATGQTWAGVTGPNLVDLLERVDAVEGLAVFSETTIAPMQGSDRPVHVKHARVSNSFFDVFGVRPALGRPFVPEDGAFVDPDGPPPLYAAVISFELWQRAFGGDPNVLGRVVRIWGGDNEIVGVMPPGFRLLTPAGMNIGDDVDVWTDSRDDYASRDRLTGWGYGVVARLAPEATLAAAAAEVTDFADSLRAEYPEYAANGLRLRVDPIGEGVVGRVRPMLLVMMGAVGFVLLIACANVANLLLARGASRESELALRTALGADRGRIVRQVLTESAVLAALGATAGVALAVAAVRALRAVHPPDLPRVQEISVDLGTLGFTAAVALVATVLAGLLPAVQASRGGGLGGRLGTRGGTASHRAQAMLVVLEVALSVVLLVGAGLMIRTFMQLQRHPLGFRPEQVVTVTVTQHGGSLEERQQLERELLAAIDTLPELEASGLVFPLPMNGVYRRDAEFAVAGTEDDPAAWSYTYFRTISPGYLATMDLELLTGRDFTMADENPDVPVVIVDQRIAAEKWPGASPLGQRLTVRGMRPDDRLYEVVGVVEPAPQWDHRDTAPTLYFPRIHYQSAEISLVGRTRRDPAAASAAMVTTVRRIAPDLPTDVVEMQTLVSGALGETRFVLSLMGVFALVALLLAAGGVYGVLAYSVRQRTRDIGIKMAIGADGGALVKGIVLDGVRLTAVGVALGGAGALLLGGLIDAWLFGVGARDPWSLIGTGLVVLAVAFVASYLPARRASRIDPLIALQAE